jgi:cytochrome c peroxidase
MMRVGAAAIAIATVACTGDPDCSSYECDFNSEELLLLRSLTNLGPPPEDRSNKFVDTLAAVALGQQFFFDPGFSGAPAMVDALNRPVPSARTPLSCASCHDPANGGSDHLSVPSHISVGTGWSAVNAGSVINAPYQPLVFWNGRADSLWGMIVPVVEAKLAMNSDRLLVAHRINNAYRDTYLAIFGEYPWPFDDGVELPPRGKPGDGMCNPNDMNDRFDCLSPDHQDAITRIAVNYAKAIAAYEYQLVVRTTAFDRYLDGGARIPDGAVRGGRLFVGKAGCIECHNGPFLSDGLFHNIGAPQVGDAVPTEAECTAAPCDCTNDQSASCIPWGAFDGRKKLSSTGFKRTSKWSDDKSDTSRAAFYENDPELSLKGAWRTPTLRDVARTGPYMHSGAYKTLEDVVDHYNRGGSGGGSAPAYLDAKIRPLGLDAGEIEDLVAFLQTLTNDPLPIHLVSAPDGIPP